LNPSALAVLAPLSDAVDRVPLRLLFLLQLLGLNLRLALVHLTRFKDNNCYEPYEQGGTRWVQQNDAIMALSERMLSDLPLCQKLFVAAASCALPAAQHPCSPPIACLEPAAALRQHCTIKRSKGF
jgi:hypothetical protein